MAVREMLSLLLELSLNHYLLLSSTALLFYFVLNRETRNVPPGPAGLPILGYIPFLKDSTAHVQLWKLSRKYGSVLRVNDHKSAIELLANEATNARPLGNLFTLLLGDDDHLINWSGPLWKEHRRFALRALRRVGVGKPEMERLIGSEINYMLDKMEKDGRSGAEAVNVDNYLTPSTANVVNAFLTGKRFDYDHPFRVKQDTVFNNGNLVPTCWTGYVANFVSVFRWLQRIPTKMNQLFKGITEVVHASLQQETKAQLETPSAPDANFVAAYLAEIQSKKENGDETFLSVDRAVGLGASLLDAGSATVRDSMEWAFLYCAYRPEIQDKLISELEKVVGYERKPLYADRANMPYTQAFLWETMRHATSIPINLPHAAISDIQINGHIIPKGYYIYVNTWAIHNDPNYWDEPEDFKVERFLSPEGDKLVKREAFMQPPGTRSKQRQGKGVAFMPFSTGRRSCPGEPLAQVELFIYLTMTLQRYKIEAPVGVQLSLKGVINNFTISPKHLTLTFRTRK